MHVSSALDRKKSSTITRVMAEESIDWAVATALEGKGKNQSSLLESIKILQRATATGDKADQSASSPSLKSHDRFDFFRSPD